MRQWLSLNHLLQVTFYYFPLRCLPVLEELEKRDVPRGGEGFQSVSVYAPETGTPQPPENTSYIFSGDSSFNIYDSYDIGQSFDATLSATNGTISVDLSAAQSLSLTVSNDGTAAVDVQGTLDNINTFLESSGITFTPTAYYSGDATVTVAATDLELGGQGSASIDVQVQPVASNITLSVNPSGELPLPSGPFAFPPGFVTVSPWPDHDGSETTTVTFRLDAANPDAFTLSAGGVEITPESPGVWEVSGSDPVAFQAILNSLVLTPPPGFSGVVGLQVDALLVDTASYPSSETSPVTSVSFAGTQDVALRFFVGQSVTSPPVFAQEGATIDLGGQYQVADPDELPGDVHTLTLSVPSGTLSLNAYDVPGGLLISEQTSGTETTIQLTGTIDEINQFLATPGSMTYTADSPFFAGRIPLSLTLQNHLGPAPSDLFDEGKSLPEPFTGPIVSDGIPDPATGVSSLFFLPSAERAIPTALNVSTNENTPISLSISVSPIANPEGTESELIVLEGVPAGATLNHGTDLGNGEWALSLSDLSGLTFTPPPDQTGVYTLTVKVVVTNAPADVSPSATDSESTTFTVTVVSATTSTQLELPSEPVDAPVIVLTGPVESSPATGEEPDSSTSTDEHPDVQAVTVALFYTTASVSNVNFQSSVSEQRVAFAPTQSTPFTPTEAPLPIYSGGEKHPLPPVLPLDQTLPVAGFTESGGDSFALLDALYRGTAQPNQPTTVSRTDTPAAETVFTVREAPPVATPKVEKTVKEAMLAPSVALATSEPPTAAVPDDSSSQDEWRVAAASVLVGPLAAWLWVSRKGKKRFRRAVYNILSLIPHRSTERTP